MGVKIRASEAERAEWHAKARSAGLTLSELVRRSVGRVRAWTVAHSEVERERTRELARIGANLNQLARWAIACFSPAPVGHRHEWAAGSGDSSSLRRADIGAETPGGQRGAEPYLARPQCSTLRRLA